jgi:hypothetical protein
MGLGGRNSLFASALVAASPVREPLRPEFPRLGESFLSSAIAPVVPTAAEMFNQKP